MLCLTLPGVSGPLKVHVDTQRTSLDLLDSVAIVITVINSKKQPVVASFPTAVLYDIDIRRGSEDVWRWSAGHAAAPVVRSYTFPPGKTRLVTYIWDALADTRSLSPGEYRVHVSLSDMHYHPSTDFPMHFAVPLPISALSKIPVGAAVTIAGALRPQQTGVELFDTTGAIRLSKRIAMQAPEGEFIVRGYVTKAYGETFFTVDRWARAADNIEPAPSAAPTRALPPLPPRRTSDPPTPRRTGPV